MQTISSTFAYHPADDLKPDLTVPTSVVKRYAFSNPAMTAARRRHYSPGLEADIRQNGILRPLVIYTNGTSGLLADGYLRLGIAEKLGITKLPVQVYPNNFRRLHTENGYPPLEPKIAAWAEKNLMRHTKHEVTRHFIGGGYASGIQSNRFYRCRCSCGAYWKEEA